MQVDSFTKNLCGPSDLPDLSASGSNSMRLEEDKMDHEIEEKKKKKRSPFGNMRSQCFLHSSFKLIEVPLP